MLRTIEAGFVCLMLAGLACADEPQPAAERLIVPSTITAGDVRAHIEFLAHPDREGRQGAGLAASADYIEEWFRTNGLTPAFGESFRQSIPSGTPEADSPPIGQNIGALIPGSDPELAGEFIMVTAHYDHLGKRRGIVYPGADDNASGVAMLLETARAIAHPSEKPRRSILFVAFDLEERLLYGSRWFAAHPPVDLRQVKLFITADLIGRSLGDLPLPYVFVMGSEASPELGSLLRRLEPPKNLKLGPLGVDIVGTRSDYASFRERQIPFLFFSTGEHADYHTPRDTPDRIDFEKCASISNVILTAATTIASSETAPVWKNRPAPNVDEIHTIEEVTSAILVTESTGQRKLSDLQRAFVEQLHSRAKFISARGRVSPEERKWIARGAQALLFSLF
jgi:hypothetical protein